MAANDGTRPVDLDAYRWQNRLVLICAPSHESRAYVRQKDLLAGQREGLQDRDIIVLELLGMGASRIGPSPLTTDQQLRLRDDYAVPAGDFHFILIGKDGGVKLRESQPVPSSDLFALIDRMPMRQEEMRRKANVP